MLQQQKHLDLSESTACVNCLIWENNPTLTLCELEIEKMAHKTDHSTWVLDRNENALEDPNTPSRCRGHTVKSTWSGIFTAPTSLCWEWKSGFCICYENTFLLAASEILQPFFEKGTREIIEVQGTLAIILDNSLMGILGFHQDSAAKEQRSKFINTTGKVGFNLKTHFLQPWISKKTFSKMLQVALSICLEEALGELRLRSPWPHSALSPSVLWVPFLLSFPASLSTLQPPAKGLPSRAPPLLFSAVRNSWSCRSW